jgi:type I restriction enzyme S subunit
MANSAPIPHPDTWPVRRLGEFSLKIGSGATPTGGEASYLPRRLDWALVRSQNVFDRRFSEEGLAYISDEQAARLSGVKIQPRDILLNITGDGITFARACEAPARILPAVVNQHVSIIRVDPKVADPGFILAYLSHPNVKHYIESFNAGGSRRAITKGHIESFCIPLAPLPEQRAIARILGTLDDKIELNRRMNETLEAMAQALFKSWFVAFDPVRAKAEGRDPSLPTSIADLFPDCFEDSNLGEVPEGWHVGRLDDVLVLQRGFDLPTPKRTIGPYPVIAASGPNGSHNQFMVRGPGVITGRSGVLGNVFYVHEDFWPLNTCLWVKQFKHSTPAFAFHLLRGLDFSLYNAGSAVPTLNRNHVHNLPVIVPSMSIIQAFEGRIVPLMKRQKVNVDETRTLATLRDALLPKLFSGELQIKDVERFIGRQV